jgi:hypothetical protein
MTNKQIFLVMLAITLAFGLTFMGCDKDSEEDEASFIGEWSGNYTLSGEDEAKVAVITFTATTWTLTAVELGINQSGTYEKSILNSATLKSKDGYIVGTATIIPITGTLTLSIIQGIASGKGSFNSGKRNTGEFKGTWTGTFEPTEGEEKDATIEFTDATWILKTGATKIDEGTYTQINSYSANLMQGVKPIGNVTIIPIAGTLSLRFLPTSDTKGTGNFNCGTQQGDSFKGTWTGTYKPSGGNDIPGATFAFSGNSWTLSYGTTTQTGTYEETSLLPTTATASLKTGSQGITVGTASVLLLVNKLTVTIMQGNASGSGSFNRP